jgi:fluoroquinolone transport system permease protein
MNMASLARSVAWDVGLQFRSMVYTATVVSTLVICGFILILPVDGLSGRWATFFIFIDPATIGLSFVGAVVLMEKSQGTLVALGVTPMRPWVYVASKVLSLTLLTFASGLVVAWVAAEGFNLGRLLVALALSSVVAVLIGFACVARAPSMNKLTVTLLWVSTLGFLPLLAHFELLPGVLDMAMGLIPSYAILLALLLAVDPGSVSPAQAWFAYGYLVIWCGVGWWWALREYTRSIVTDGK